MSVSDSEPSKKISLPKRELCDLLRLPENVIDNILMHLPLADVAKTSVLSTKWRYRWRLLPQLVFDISLGGRLDPFSVPERRKVKLIIYKVLLLHRAPIRKFRLCSFVDGSDVDSLIQSHSMSEVEDFSLQMSGSHYYKLLSHFFLFSQLKRLCLHYCELKPPKNIRGFSKLVTLELCSVVFDNTIQTFISSSSELQELRLLECRGPPSLEVSGVNLRRLEIVNGFESLSLKNVPKLVDLSVRTCVGEATICTVEDFCCCVPSVEKLNMNVYPKDFATHNTLDKPPTALNLLKRLNLGNLRLERVDDIACAIWLIRESPSIKFLSIEFECECRYYGCSLSVLKLLKREHRQNYSLNHLREVQIENAFNGISLMEFIKFLLAKSPNLHKLAVMPVDRLSVDEKLEMATKMLEFPRASTNVKIKLMS